MARADSIKMIERHVEKLVLGVCLLALLLASWHWLLSSPTKLRIFEASTGKTVPVSPTEADKKLLDSALAVGRMYSGSDVRESIPPVPAWVGRLDDQRAIYGLPASPTDLGQPRLVLAPVEPPTQPVVTGIQELLAAMPAPGKPVVISSIELPKRAPANNAVLARGASDYPLEDLTAAWKKLLPTTTITFERPVPYRVIVEVQQAPADGNWSNAKTVPVETAPLDITGKPIETPAIPDYDGKNFVEVRKARDDALAMQNQILQPNYLPVWRAGQWVQPELPARMEAPNQPAKATIAFFDDTTMTEGPAYRYRVQLVFVNPLLTYDDVLEESRQAEARQKFLTSPPSPWSDPVSARREIHFFITGSNPLANRMTVTVFVRQWGHWVSKNFDVQVGEFIGGLERVDLIDPMDKSKKSVEVDFSTGCVAVRLDFKKTLFRRGFRLTTPEMLYLDAEGRLQSVLKTWHESSDLLKQLQQAVRNAAVKD